MSYGNENPFFMPVQPAYGYGGNGGGMFGGWGNDWMWLIVLFLFGWNNNGGGLFGGGMNGGVGSEVQRGFDHSSVIMKLDGLTTGLADLGYAMNNGFHGTDTAICNLGYQTQAGFNALAAQLAKCCCDNREAISNLRYDMATESCSTKNLIQSTARDILENNNSNTRAILDFLTQDKISSLQAENQSLKFQASQNAQNGFIEAVANSLEAKLRLPTPIPAYTVPNPFVGYSYGYGYGGCNPCGCAA